VAEDNAAVRLVCARTRAPVSGSIMNGNGTPRRIDLPAVTSRRPTRPLIALGNCVLLTARALAAALRKGVA
jgi:hypothetical protein